MYLGLDLYICYTPAKKRLNHQGKNSNQIISLGAGTTTINMFPIRCYTCNSTIAQKHPEYANMLSNNVHPLKAFQTLGIERMCCRRMFLGYVNLTVEQMHFGNTNIVIDKTIVIQREITGERVVSCE